MASKSTSNDQVTSAAELSDIGIVTIKAAIPSLAQLRYGLAVLSAIALAGLLCTGLGRGMGKVAIYFM